MDDNDRIDELWQQVRSDNEFYSLMMGNLAREMKAGFTRCADGLQQLSDDMRVTADEMRVTADEMRVHAANSDERMRQIEGRQRLQEQRFGTMLKAVPSMEQFQALEQRVKKLEER